MKRKFDKKIVSGLVISLLSTQMVQALAQGVSTQSSGSTVSSLSTSSPTIASLPNLSVLSATSIPTQYAGCNAEIMQNLNSGYLLSRGNARILQYNNQMNGLVLTTPKANQMDCFQQAMQNIKNLMSAINSIIAMFSGQIDMDSIMQQIVNMVLKAACQEINQVTGSISGSLNTVTNGINSTVNTVTGTTIGFGGVSTTVGGIINSGSSGSTGTTDIVGGSLSSVNNTLTSIGSTANNASTTGSALINKIESVSPFSSGTSN